MCGQENQIWAASAREGRKPLLTTCKHCGARLSRPPQARQSRCLDWLVTRCYFQPFFVYHSKCLKTIAMADFQQICHPHILPKSRFNRPFVSVIDGTLPIFGERHLPGCQVSVVQSQDPAGGSILLLGDVLCNRKPQLPVCNGLHVSIQQWLNECEPLLSCGGQILLLWRKILRRWHTIETAQFRCSYTERTLHRIIERNQPESICIFEQYTVNLTVSR